MKKYLFTTFILLSIISCKPEYNEPTSLFNTNKVLNSVPLPISSDLFSIPLQMITKDTLLIVLDRYQKDNNTFIYKAFNTNNGNTISTFGRIGKGPDEFQFPSFLTDISYNSNLFGVYNGKRFMFNELSIDSIVSNSRRLTVKSYQNLSNFYSKIIKTDKEHFFGSGFFDKGRYALSDTAGNILTVKGDYPFEHQFSLSKRDLGMAFQCKLKKHPNKQLVVSATANSANLEIIKVGTHGFEVIKKINSRPTIFENNGSKNRIDVDVLQENRYGYQNVSITKDYIYALYSGKKMDKSYHYTDIVLVFDWEGNPVIRYNLDQEVRYISAKANNEALFAISKNEDGDHEVRKFSLNPDQ